MSRASIAVNSEFDVDRVVAAVVSSPEKNLPATTPPKPARPLHRLAAVRKEQGISLTRVARNLDIDIAEARREEEATTDLALSRLYRWRAVLEVPVGELVIEPDEIPGNPIKSRCQLIKMMKTARTIQDLTREQATSILAGQLVDELLELMPELQTISPWPSIGQARETREPGQAALRRFDSGVSRRMEE